MLAGSPPGPAAPPLRSRRLLAVVALLASLSAGPASAQVVAPGAGAGPPARASGVLRPPAQVDQGMIRPAPNLPAQSTPVIHPRRLRRNGHGAVRVVPK